PAEAATRDALLDLAYGPARFTKASERLREGRRPELALVAAEGRRVVGTVQLWRGSAGHDRPAVLLGPLAVPPGRRKRGVGADPPQARHRLDAGASRATRGRPSAPWRRAAGRRRALLLAVRLLQREDQRAVAARAVRAAPAAWARAQARRPRRRPWADQRPK